MVHIPFIEARISSFHQGRIRHPFERPAMKNLLIKVACLAALASALSGCIMYVAPDHDYDTSPPASAGEKPADVMTSSKSF
ncbi:hypothetical protein MMA231_02073 [Asticcacaulis sp. MM231]